jgi:hypothetical protein
MTALPWLKKNRFALRSFAYFPYLIFKHLAGFFLKAARRLAVNS